MVYVPTVSLNHIVTVLQCFSIAGSFLPHCNVYLTDAISLPLFSLKNKLNVEECWMRCLKDSQSLKTVQFLGKKMQSSGDGLEARGREGTFQLDARTCFTQDISDLIVHFALALEARDERWIYNNGGGRKRDWKVGRGAWSIICWAVVRIEVLAANRTPPTISSLSSSAPAFSTETTFMVRAHRSPTSRKCEGHLKIIRHITILLLFWSFFLQTLCKRFYRVNFLHPWILSEVKAPFGKIERGFQEISLTDHLQESIREEVLGQE